MKVGLQERETAVDNDLQPGYKYIYCKHHKNKKLGQVREGFEINIVKKERGE